MSKIKDFVSLIGPYGRAGNGFIGSARMALKVLRSMK
jgi:hypothetical protein